MKAIILAAGRGERMRPLTDKSPKPLLLAAGKPLIEYTIEQLEHAGIHEIIINVAHLGHKIIEKIGNGSRFNVSIQYSDEGTQALETAGGIIKALPLLGKEPFLVINGDIATDFPFAKLLHQPVDMAHLILIDNPPHHPNGDFSLDGQNRTINGGENKYTYSGIGIYHPALFNQIPPGIIKLRPILDKAMQHRLITGERYEGFWMDIGTPERLQELEQIYLKRN